MTEPVAGVAEAAENDDRELVIGLVTPVGTNIERLASGVRAALSRWAYMSHVVKVSSLMPPSPAPMAEPRTTGSSG